MDDTWVFGDYEWVFLHQYLNQPWSEPASLKAHGAPWISSVTLIFIWVHIIYVGTLWSASELSIHKAMQERGLEESDNAVSTNTAQMIGEDKSFGGGGKSWNFISDGFSDDLKANRPCFVAFNHIAFFFCSFEFAELIIVYSCCLIFISHLSLTRCIWLFRHKYYRLHFSFFIVHHNLHLTL